MIDENSRAALHDVLRELVGSFVTGSYLVDKKTANDIDVVVGDSAFLLSTDKYESIGFGEFCLSGVRFEKQENEDENGGDYGDAENEMFELVEHWRGGSINVLVIKDIFIAAYKAASYALEANPNSHTSRDQRVETHQKYKGVIRDMLTGAANDSGDLPW